MAIASTAALAGLAAALGTGAVGYGGYKGIQALAGGGGKKKGAEAQYFDPYPEQRQQLMNLLYQGTQEGVPGLEQYGQERFQELMPDIRGLYEARRGLGIGSTPEIAALGRGARGVATDISQLQAQARQRYTQMYGTALGQPTTAITPAPTPAWQQMLGFAAPIAGQYMQTQALQKILPLLLGGAGDIAPTFDPYGGGEEYTPDPWTRGTAYETITPQSIGF